MGKFDWFGVYPIVQHPTFVVISAQTQLLLLVSHHPLVPHPETSVGYHILAAFQRCLKTLPRDLVLLLGHPLRAKLLFFRPLVHRRNNNSSRAQSSGFPHSQA